MKPASGPNDKAASANIAKRIEDLGDWRGKTLAHVRQLILDADPEIQEEWKWVKPTNPGVPVWSRGGGVDLLPFAEIDRTPRVPFQTGIEELLRVFDGGSAIKSELHDLLVRFPCADAAIMGPDGGSWVRWLYPFPLLLDVGVGIEDELTDMS